MQNILIDSNAVIGLVVFYIPSTYKNHLEESKLFLNLLYLILKINNPKKLIFFKLLQFLKN